MDKLLDRFKKLSPPLQVVVAGSLLLFIFSFLDWQQVSIGGFTAGRSLWDGVGVIAGLFIVAVLVWEGLRLAGLKADFGTVTAPMISVALALLMFLFVLITFLDHSTARHWPAWIGFILSIVVAAAAVIRAKEEDVPIPGMKPSS